VHAPGLHSGLDLGRLHHLPCHQTHYAIATGVPTPDSPAKAPLAPIDIKVKGSEIDLA
jgi:Rieske Fe-S protein